MLSRRLRPVTEDAGITLIEMVVSMVLSLMIGTAAIAWFVAANSATHKTTEAEITTASARNALQSWAQLLRVADSPTSPGNSASRILSITPTSISFNANLANRATCTSGTCATGATTVVTLSMEAVTVNGVATKRLVQDMTGTNTQRNVLIPAQVSSTSSCLFTPYDSTGAALACSGLTAGALATVARVDIAFTLTPTIGPAQIYKTSASITGNMS
jgi:type II secretory pathway pseudopilin PulG